MSDEEHVLVVGGGMEIPGLLRAHRPGVRTSVLCQLALLPRLWEPAGHQRVVALGPDCPDQEWIDAAALIHAADPVTRIATLGERDQDRAAAVGVALGLPMHAPDTVAAVHDKATMRRVLAASGVERVRSHTVDNAEDLARWVADNPGTWVVKPLDGSGSAGVGVICDPQDASARYERCVGSSHTGRAGAARVLVEEFLTGREISVESFSEQGEHVVVAVTQKFTDPATLVELGHVIPAELDADTAEAVRRHTARVLSALGVRDGPCHTELVLTDDGPRTIETHLRLAGDEIPYLAKDATGVDLVGLVVAQTLGETVLPGLRQRLAEPGGPAQAIWFGASPCAGTLVSVEGADDRVVVAVKPGDQLGELSDSGSRPLWARADGPDPATAVRLAREAVARCRLIVSVPSAQADGMGATA
ncbi:ATP-grasp domain-containing protein [Kutzneria sp. NPDC052558]|uniref:ATP-grasp domain-containing protein n=1 Tax=Kutzneria sp. NPDC052558 TaxID=3364121 RepID=UPI0037CA89B4